MTVKPFKAMVPSDIAIPSKQVYEHPFDLEKCRGCNIFSACRNTSKKLPFEVKEVCKPHLVHTNKACGAELTACWVDERGVPLYKESSEPTTVEKETEASTPEIYLLDANIFIYSWSDTHKNNSVCRWVLAEKSLKKGTTMCIVREIWVSPQDKSLKGIKVFNIPKIEKELRELKPGYLAKKPSEADLSLMQAVIDNDDVKGIITFDYDFFNVAAAGILKNRTGRDIEVVMPDKLYSRIKRGRK